MGKGDLVPQDDPIEVLYRPVHQQRDIPIPPWLKTAWRVFFWIAVVVGYGIMAPYFIWVGSQS